jgi:tRNA(fMet)-specific endonuclease VapC
MGMKMTNKILVDTSIVISGQNNQVFLMKIKSLQDSLVISRITACEMIFGSRNKKEKEKNLTLVHFLPNIDVTEEISSKAYDLIDKYGLRVKLGIADALIAATAIEKQIPLWTLNTKHFKMIEELELFET